MTSWLAPHSFEHIVLLPAGIKQDEMKRWVSTDLTEEDDRLGAPGGKLRVFATALLAQHSPRAQIITGGGLGLDVKDPSTARPLLSEILSEELIESGVSPGRILLESASNTTMDSLRHLQEKSQKTDLGRVAIVTNDYHRPRVEAMLKTQFPGMLGRVSLQTVAAEEVLLEEDPETWRALIEKVYASPFMKARIALEKKGEAQIYDGTYRFK